jgi:prepilin-type processing-associated H-X9-DG protein
MTSYLGVTGSDNNITNQFFGPTNGIFELGSPGTRFADITDGTSNTLFVGERPPAGDLFWGWWSVSDYDCLLSVQNQVTFYGGSISPGIFRAPTTKPINFSAESNHFYSLHTGGANWLFGDGSIHFLSYSSQPATIPLATKGGGEATPNY